MMIEKRSMLWVGALSLWGLFFPAAIFLERQILFEVLNSLSFAVAVGVLVGYGPDAVRSLRTPLRELRPGQALLIGVAIAWLGTALVFGVLWWWRIQDKPDAVIDSVWNAFPRWMIITGGLLHLVASRAVDDVIPPQAYLRLGWWIALGLGISAVTVTVMSQ